MAISGIIINAAHTSYRSPGKKSRLHSKMNVNTRDENNGVIDSSVAIRLNTFPNSSLATSFDNFERIAIETSPPIDPGMQFIG